MLVSSKTEYTTITRTLHLNTTADMQCLHLGETFKLNVSTKTSVGAVCKYHLSISSNVERMFDYMKISFTVSLIALLNWI